MRYVVFSFDDARDNFYTNVLPVLRKYHVPATVNVITGRVKEEKGHNEHMTLSEIRECHTSGLVEIASHSSDHSNTYDAVVSSLQTISSWELGNYVGGGMRLLTRN